MPTPICFVVMPFRTKDTGASPPAPGKVNFDSLWERALQPLIEELGYRPVRADQDLGGMIIKDMLERLYFSDLVIADLTIPNGNVYYEVGVRHAAKPSGCVLISADWSRQLFDLDQIRQARYPLPEAEVSGEIAKQIKAALAASIRPLAEGASPVFQTLPGYPTAVAADRAGTIQAFLDELSDFQATVTSIRRAPAKEARDRSLALRDQHPADEVKLPTVALELAHLLRDYVDWTAVVDFVDSLPNSIRKLPVIQEQRCLAQSNSGDHAAAIGALEKLIRNSGDSSERQGLLGGRYKRLYREATSEGDSRRYLGKAIEHYERGMMLDLNDYYPSFNLPGLYRERGKRGDEDRARAAATVARLGCERAIQHKADDQWTRPTLLGLAFLEGDLDAVDELHDRIIVEQPATWKLETTIKDLEAITKGTPDVELRSGLEQALSRLKALVQ